MKLLIRHLNVRSTDSLDSLVEERLMGFEARLEIEEANVDLAYHHQTSPSFRSRINVVTPGPDILVEAKGHTIIAAFEQAASELDRKLDKRDRNRLQKSRGSRRRQTHLNGAHAGH